MSTAPKPPSSALAYVTVTTGALAATLIGAAVTTFAIRWDSRMSPAEIRLALTGLFVTAVCHALWTKYTRDRTRYESFADYAPFKARLAEFGQRLDHLDEGLASIAGRTQRLANCLETIEVTEGPGEETGDIIRMPKPRQPHLRGLKSG